MLISVYLFWDNVVDLKCQTARRRRVSQLTNEDSHKQWIIIEPVILPMFLSELNNINEVIKITNSNGPFSNVLI